MEALIFIAGALVGIFGTLAFLRLHAWAQEPSDGGEVDAFEDAFGPRDFL